MKRFITVLALVAGIAIVGLSNASANDGHRGNRNSGHNSRSHSSRGHGHVGQAQHNYGHGYGHGVPRQGYGNYGSNPRVYPNYDVHIGIPNLGIWIGH